VVNDAATAAALANFLADNFGVANEEQLQSFAVAVRRAAEDDGSGDDKIGAGSGGVREGGLKEEKKGAIDEIAAAASERTGLTAVDGQRFREFLVALGEE
jgi:hypothetical protein